MSEKVAHHSGEAAAVGPHNSRFELRLAGRTACGHNRTCLLYSEQFLLTLHRLWMAILATSAPVLQPFTPILAR